MESKELDEMFCKSDIYIKFVGMSKFKNKESFPIEEDWKELIECFSFFYPAFILKLKKEKMTVIRFRLCLLSCMGFRSKEIKNLLGLRSSQQVSNIKRGVNNIFFNENCASSLKQNLRSLL